MFRQRIPFTQIALATVLGVTGGVYIYRPMFESQRNNSVPETLICKFLLAETSVKKSAITTYMGNNKFNNSNFSK
uniref:Protein PIGBOS1 n=1 Tax=Esox lucius TaxID=8010 RepID=A0AAY5KBJ5_ESOLU